MLSLYALLYSILYCVIALLSFVTAKYPIHGSIFFLERTPTWTAAWPCPAVCIRCTVCCRGSTSSSAAHASHVSVLKTNPVPSQKLQPADAESLYGTSLRLIAAVTFAGFPYNSNSLLRHLGYSFLLRSILQLIFPCAIRLLCRSRKWSTIHLLYYVFWCTLTLLLSLSGHSV